MKNITRNIFILSLVSMFNDVSSEMLIPIVPLYLQSIGFTTLLIGVLEGIAEATAGLTKIYFGNLSDRIGKRNVFVQMGYAMSAIGKPMLGLSSFTGVIFSARFLDRLGKGVRTGARDAMLSDETTMENKGAVFGFHKAFDTMGATLGPIIALAFLFYFPKHYRPLFLLAFIPAVVSVLFTFTIREKKNTPSAGTKPSLLQSFSYWKKATPSYRKLIAPLLLFALVNSADAFLLLMLKTNGMSDTNILLVYIFYNVVFAALSYPLGKLADKVGLKKMLCFGLLVYAIAYSGMAFNHHTAVFYLLFFAYGIYQAATDGISKALISNVVPKSETASAIGFFAGTQSICILLCNIAAGFLWMKFGAPVIFVCAALGALLAAGLIATQKIQFSKN